MKIIGENIILSQTVQPLSPFVLERGNMTIDQVSPTRATEPFMATKP